MPTPPKPPPNVARAAVGDRLYYWDAIRKTVAAARVDTSGPKRLGVTLLDAPWAREWHGKQAESIPRLDSPVGRTSATGDLYRSRAMAATAAMMARYDSAARYEHRAADERAEAEAVRARIEAGEFSDDRS